MTEAGFKRLWRAPRRTSWGSMFEPPTAHQRYLREESLARYLRRPDAYPFGEHVLRGELGVIENIRFIISRDHGESA